MIPDATTVRPRATSLARSLGLQLALALGVGTSAHALPISLSYTLSPTSAVRFSGEEPRVILGGLTLSVGESCVFSESGTSCQPTGVYSVDEIGLEWDGTVFEGVRGVRLAGGIGVGILSPFVAEPENQLGYLSPLGPFSASLSGEVLEDSGQHARVRWLGVWTRQDAEPDAQQIVAGSGELPASFSLKLELAEWITGVTIHGSPTPPPPGAVWDYSIELETQGLARLATVSLDAVSIPEPSTRTLLGLACAALLGLRISGGAAPRAIRPRHARLG